MSLKPAPHYGREAYMLMDGMREAIEEHPDLPDSLARDVETTMTELKAEFEAARELLEEVDTDA